MKLLLTLLLLLPTLLYPQKIAEIDGKFAAKIEYSASGKDIDSIFNMAKSWIEIEFKKSKINNVSISTQSKKLSTTVYDKKLSFDIEIICSNGSFIAKFKDFYINKKILKTSQIKKVDKYLFELSGRMQKYIRYGQR